MGVAGSNRRGGGAGSSPAAGSFRVTIPSDFSSGRDVQERIMAEVERHAFGTDSAFAVRIALEEAMVNAIKHGNRLDPAKKVHVECKVTPRRAEITIEDEGPGFDRAAIPDPTHDDNLDKPSGRGILLIEAYMDGVQWSRGGRRLRMVKENQP
jgi:serine/threonine-protein kinase RsbW